MKYMNFADYLLCVFFITAVKYINTEILLDHPMCNPRKFLSTTLFFLQLKVNRNKTAKLCLQALMLAVPSQTENLNFFISCNRAK